MIKVSKFAEAFIGGVTLIFVIGLVYSFSIKYFEYKPSTYKKYNTYKAKFSDIDGLVVGSEVKLGGIVIGKLVETSVDQKSYKIDVRFSVLDKYKVPEDSVLSVSTNGLIGEKYLRLSIGNSDNFLKPNDEVEQTQSAVSLEGLISLLKK